MSDMALVGNMPEILAAEDALKEMEQVDLQLEHYIIPGVYCRVLHIPAGVALTGKIHLKEHISILAAGELLVADADKQLHIKAPKVMIDRPGIKRLGYAITDCTFINVLATDKQDVEDIEKESVVSTYDEYVAYQKLLTQDEG